MKRVILSLIIFCALTTKVSAQIVPVGESLELNKEDSTFVKYLSATIFSRSDVPVKWTEISAFVFKYAEGYMVITYLSHAGEYIACVRDYEIGNVYEVKDYKLANILYFDYLEE